MSPTTSARGRVRVTARQWWSISSMVTGTVLSYPRANSARVSPTRIRSTPAPSARRALAAS